MESKVLIVEDSPTCQIIARESTRHLGEVTIAENCQQARTLVATQNYDYILLDMLLPDGDGIDLFSEFKNHSNCSKTRFVFVTSNDDISKKVAVFAVGADDYIVKPYSRLELRARLDRFQREKSESNQSLFPNPSLKLDPNSLSAFANKEGKFVNLNLTPHEFKIFVLLVRNQDRIYSRNQIIDLVWGHDVNISDRTVDVHISSLRKKLDHHNKNLLSVRGEGYRWTQAV